MATTLKDIADEILYEASTQDSIFRNKEAPMVYKWLKVGMKNLNLTFAQNIRGLNIVVPAVCRVYKPHDYEQFIRAYILNCDGKRIEIARNNDIPEKISHFLVNCDGTLLQNCDLEELKDDCLKCNPPNNVPECCREECDRCGGTGRCFSKEVSQLLHDMEMYGDSWISEHSDNFEFSQNLEDVAVVIEYMSNSLNSIEECKIVVPSDFEMALENYTKYKLLQGSEVTMGYAKPFYDEYKAYLNKIQTSRNGITDNELKSIMLLR